MLFLQIVELSKERNATNREYSFKHEFDNFRITKTSGIIYVWHLPDVSSKTLYVQVRDRTSGDTYQDIVNVIILQNMTTRGHFDIQQDCGEWNS